MPLAGGAKGQQQKQVAGLETQWRVALLAGDNATLSALLADDYVGIGPDGTIMSKAEELQARASGQEHLERLELEEGKVPIYGTTPVVISKARVQGVYFGEPLLGEYRYTRVWNLTRGQWHIVSFEANRVHDSTERSH